MLRAGQGGRFDGKKAERKDTDREGYYKRNEVREGEGVTYLVATSPVLLSSLRCSLAPPSAHTHIPTHLDYFITSSAAVAMGVTKESVEATLTTSLHPTHLEVIDTSGGCGASFDVEIATAAFEGKRLLERHRIVNTALTEELKDIHALSISKALTPQQWSDQKSSPPAVKEQLAHQPGAVEQPAAATA